MNITVRPVTKEAKKKKVSSYEPAALYKVIKRIAGEGLCITYYAPSSEGVGHVPYTVPVNYVLRKALSCTCEDYVKRQKELAGDTCKHMDAVTEVLKCEPVKQRMALLAEHDALRKRK